MERTLAHWKLATPNSLLTEYLRRRRRAAAAKTILYLYDLAIS